MQKLGIKDSLPGLLGMPFFSVLCCLRSSGVLLYCLPLSPFFSLFSSLLFPFFSVLLSFSWKLALRRMKTTSAEASALSQRFLLMGTAKAMATPVLVSVRFLSFCYCFLSRWWRWRRVVLVELLPLPLCFPCFRQCRSYGFLCPASLSFLLVFLFLSFFVLSFILLPFFSFFSLFTVTNRNSYSLHFIYTSLAVFSALFTPFFSSFYALFFCPP